MCSGLHLSFLYFLILTICLTLSKTSLFSLWIYLTVVYGLRRSEVLGLKWDSINLEQKSVTIKHTIVRYFYVVEKDSTKTASSFRTYPMTEDVERLLMKLKNCETENKALFGKK